MRENIHPEFHPDAQVACACGNTWTVGSTVPLIRTDVCFACHPFFTGEQRIVDSGGMVERFMKKLERRNRIIADAEMVKDLATSPALPVTDLDIGSRSQKVLMGAGINTVNDILAKLEEGDEALTNLSGFGLKSLATLKKHLRARDFVLPGDEAPEQADDAPEQADDAAD